LNSKRGQAMTRSVEEIRQESGRDRMELANTLGLLKTKSDSSLPASVKASHPPTSNPSLEDT
jgi:hypothetical protein